MTEHIEKIRQNVTDKLMFQKESILSAAFRLTVIEIEKLEADAYILDTDTILQYGRCVISHKGDETFFYKDQPVITFFPAEIRHEDGKFFFEQKYKVHTV